MASKRHLKTIKSPVEFQAIKSSGCKVTPTSWLLVAYLDRGEGDLRCGWTVPTYVGGAVIRNRLKRWCREFFINCQSHGEGLDVNIVFRRRHEDFYKRLSHDELNVALAKAMELLDGKAKK